MLTVSLVLNAIALVFSILALVDSAFKFDKGNIVLFTIMSYTSLFCLGLTIRLLLI